MRGKAAPAEDFVANFQFRVSAIRTSHQNTTTIKSVGYSEKSRSLSASRARHSAAGKKKRGTPFGMTLAFCFPHNMKWSIVHAERDAGNKIAQACRCRPVLFALDLNTHQGAAGEILRPA
jgi:hypothetical protein